MWKTIKDKIEYYVFYYPFLFSTLESWKGNIFMQLYCMVGWASFFTGAPMTAGIWYIYEVQHLVSKPTAIALYVLTIISWASLWLAIVIKHKMFSKLHNKAELNITRKFKLENHVRNRK